MPYKKKKEVGYTFVEFVIVAMVFGVISLLVVPNFDKIINRFKQKEATGIINSLIKGAQSHYALFGALPADMGAASKFVKFRKFGNVIIRKFVNSKFRKFEIQKFENSAIRKFGYSKIEKL